MNQSKASIHNGKENKRGSSMHVKAKTNNRPASKGLKRKSTKKMDEKSEPTKAKLDKLKELEESGIFEAFEYILRSLHNGGLTETNVYDFAANRLVLYETKCRAATFKKSRIERYKKGEFDSKQKQSELNEPIAAQPIRPLPLPSIYRASKSLGVKAKARI